MRLTVNELAYLKKQYPQSNQLSLFSNIQASAENVDPEQLEKKMILHGGKVSQIWDKTLKPLALPDECTRLLLRDGQFLVEKYAYRNKEGYTLVENNGKELELTLSDSIEAQMLNLSRWIGMTNLTSLEIDLELDVSETLVLLAIVDLGRQAVFGGYLAKPVEVKTDFNSLRIQLQKPAANSLVSLLLTNYELSVPEGDALQAVLKSLAEKNIISIEGETFGLKENIALLAIQFLVPQTVILLENISLLADGSLGGGSYLAVTAGLKEILLFVMEGEKIKLVSMTGMQLLKLIENLLSFKKA